MNSTGDFIIEDDVLTGYTGCEPVAVIPDGVLAIGKNAFRDNPILTRITIPDSVTSICNHAFCGCKCLTEILGGSRITSFGSFAFMYCKSLRKITLPDSLTEIGAYAFADCTQLSALNVIPYGVTVIGQRAFKGCHSLTNMLIPDSVTTLGPGAFASCISLKDIRLSSALTRIEAETFFHCRKLKKITLPDSITVISERVFSGCSNLAKVTLPPCITKIRQESFMDCTALSEITIPDGVDRVNSKAFKDCSNLKRITIPDSLLSIGSDTLDGCQKLSEVYISPEALARLDNPALWKHCVISYSEQYLEQFCKIMRRCPSVEKSAIEWMLMHFKLYATADYFRSTDRLSEFASIHHTDEDHIWDYILKDYGLDSECCKRWNLAGKVYTAHLENNRSIILADESGAILDLLPKEGSTQEEYELAASELQELKMNVPTVLRLHLQFLERDFLAPKPQSFKIWQRMYLRIPWLKHLAKQIVWQQGETTFILNSEGLPVDAYGNQVNLNGSDSIIQAHPMELTASTLSAWKAFLAAHKLRQPYLQILEPVVDNSTIRPDRYAKVPLLAHMPLIPPDPDIQLKITTENNLYYITRIQIENFTRTTNRILVRLDQNMAEFKLTQDDISAIQYLDRFTQDGLESLIEQVAESGTCTNAVAAILAYKKDHYPDADATVFDEFALDW